MRAPCSDSSTETTARSSCRPTFATFEEASGVCEGLAYDNPLLFRVIRCKTEMLRDRSSPNADTRPAELQLLAGIALARHDPARPLVVLDYGGSCGTHYFELKSLLQSDVRFSWNIVETSGMAREGKRLENDELRFFDSLSAAREHLGTIDVLNCSGALQALPDPLETLGQLVECGARYLVLSRCALTERPRSLVIVHDFKLSIHEPAPGYLPPDTEDAVLRQPITFSPRADVESAVRRRFEILVRVADPSGLLAVNDEPVIGLGYVCRHE